MCKGEEEASGVTGAKATSLNVVSESVKIGGQVVGAALLFLPKSNDTLLPSRC